MAKGSPACIITAFSPMARGLPNDYLINSKLQGVGLTNSYDDIHISLASVAIDASTIPEA